ncbi:MAG: L-serine ammonia-lyase, iron-sulfur-dependent, subunit alpha [Coriobacteriia bacterium]
MAYSSFAELLSASVHCGSLGAAALELEAEESGRDLAELRQRMAETLGVMREAVAAGLTGDVRSRSGFVGGDAARVAASRSGPLDATFVQVIAAALATGEVNASMGRIVAAPTGGASGVLPAVLLGVGEHYGADDDRLVDALFCAAGIGGVIAARATLSGAAGGCQAEIGSASAMAAAAAVELAGGTPAQAGQAASLALQGQLGLVCDPVGGLVEVPCVFRNATGASVALAAAQMALAGVEFPIPFDEVADSMGLVGRSLPPSLRETALGGLAVTPCGREMAASLRDRD